MDNTNKTSNTENLLPKLKNPVIYYFLAFGILFFIIMLAIIWVYFGKDVKINYSPGESSNIKSQEQLVADIFIILFVCILIFGLCVIFLPSLKDFKELFLQIGNVTYVIIYTIFTILFYTMMSKQILYDYSYIINPFIICLGAFSFYKSTTQNYIEKFNINYERIKMLILFFCLITIIITFYNLNPGEKISKYFGYSLLLTIVISVFAFLYLIILLTLPDDTSKPQQNFLNNFSSFGKYGTILFIIFLVVVSILIAYDRKSFFNDKIKAGAIIIMILIISIIWSVLLGINLFSGFTFKANYHENSVMNLFKKSLLILFGIIISGLIIYWITYNLENLSSDSSIVSFVLNLLLVIIILGLVYKTINVNLPSGNSNKNGFFNLISSIIFYIPCLFSDLFDGIGKILVGEYNSASAGSLIMLILAIILVIAYFKTPSLINSISTQGGLVLVNKPVYTNSLYNLASYQDLNNSDEFDYQYAISFWVFIDAMPPNTNPNYNKFTSLLNFGNKPNVSYNGVTNTLMVTMQQKELDIKTKNNLLDFDSDGNRIIYVNKNILLQKWNNIIINYNGGTLDVFLNGELVKSSIEVVPYYTFDNLTIGENEGIQGGICNVIYFRRALTSSNIYYIYNTVKNKTPPLLNDSNETITKNNFNSVSNSIKTVT